MGKLKVLLGLLFLGLYIWSWDMYWDNIFTAAGIK